VGELEQATERQIRTRHESVTEAHTTTRDSQKEKGSVPEDTPPISLPTN
jgi:hypothetical protein